MSITNCELERANHTLQTTALIHEAYLKLIEQKNVQWESRTHFFAIAATLMRRVMLDYAKTKKRAKRGGKKSELPFEEALQISADERSIDLLALDEALNRLAEIDEQQQARVVEFKFFGGLSIEETATALSILRQPPNVIGT